jgi:hypothetical protein
MRKIDILLWTNEAQDWAIEVDGSRYENLSASTIQQFVRLALLQAETSHVDCKNGVWTISCFVSEMMPDVLWPANETYSPALLQPCPPVLQ